MPQSLPLATLLRGCGRSLWHQASWNFERMQNLGFCHQLLPGLRRLYGGDPPPAVLQRCTTYFNTHPYFASWVAGTVLNLEERQLAGETPDVDSALFPQLVMAPYAAIGDALFWGALRPLAAVAGLIFAVQGHLWAPLLLLGIFNLPHLLCRCGGWLLGYRQGVESAATLQRLRLPDLALRLKEGTVLLLGGLCALLAFQACAERQAEPLWGLLGLPLVLALAQLARRGVSSFAMLTMTAGGLIGFALLP